MLEDYNEEQHEALVWKCVGMLEEQKICIGHVVASN